MKKLITGRMKLLIFVFVLIISASVYAVQVSTVLEDNVTTINATVTHSIKAHKNIQNVTVVDYFSDVKIKDIATEKEQFLGKEWIAVHINIGNINEGETKTIEYEILDGKGEAMFGADVYYLNGEKHQLFPKKEVIDIDIKSEIETLVSSEASSDNNTTDNEKLIYVFLLGIAIIIILAIFIKSRKQ